MNNSTVEIHQPRAHFAAQALFAARIAQIADMPIHEFYKEYEV